MQWIKIFDDEAAALQVLRNDTPQLLIVNGKRICLVRHKEKFYAVQDRCTHNGDSLSKGTINYLGEVICPWHNHCFDLQSGRESAMRSSDLITYPIKIDPDGVFVSVL